MKFNKFSLFIKLKLLASIAIVASKEAEEEAPLPTFNLKGGFYETDSISLEISFSDPNAVIYYTLDGTLPTTESKLYESPLILKDRSNEENVYSNVKKVDPSRDYVPDVKVKKANVVRAMAQLSDGSFTKVVSSTYFVGLDRKKLFNNLPVVSLVTDPYNLFDYDNGIYCMGKMYDEWIAEDPTRTSKPGYEMKGNFNMKGKDGERPINIEYFPFEQDKEGFNEAAGFRIAGAVSRTFLQKSLRIIFREEYGKKNLKYEIIPGNMRDDGTGPVTKYKSFVIRNGGNDHEVTKMRDKLIQDSICNRDLETQQTDPVVAFLDGEFWGVYIITEDYNKQYMENNYGIEGDNVVIIKPQSKETHKIEEGTEADLVEFNNAYDYIAGGNMADSEQYAKANELFDLDSFAYYSALNIFIQNNDGIFQSNNWAFWHTREAKGANKKDDRKWRPLVYDTEFSIGLFKEMTDYDKVNLNEILVKGLTDTIGGKLINSLIKNANYKEMFINALCDIRNIDFEPKAFGTRFEEFYNEIHPLMDDNYHRFYTWHAEGNYESFHDKGAHAIKDWITNRHGVFVKVVGEQLGLESPVTVNVISTHSENGSFTVNHGTKLFQKEYSGDYFKENAIYLTAVPNEGSHLQSWTLSNCQFADEKYATIDETTSDQLTISLIPSENCKVTLSMETDAQAEAEAQKEAQGEEEVPKSETSGTGEESCWSDILGYSCCEHTCKVYVEDKDGKWGVENHQWCGIPDSCVEKSAQCWSMSLGYPCCQESNYVYLTDEDGSWGYEDNHWCGILSN